MLNKVRTRVLIICLNGFKQRLQGDVVINQRLLIDNDLILSDVATKTQNVSNTGHCAQLEFHDPVLNRTEFLVSLSLANNLIEIDLSRSGSDRTHLRLKTLRDMIFR